MSVGLYLLAGLLSLAVIIIVVVKICQIAASTKSIKDILIRWERQNQKDSAMDNDELDKLIKKLQK